MVVTEEFIRNNRSTNGGWNFSQISALGETWPPVKGWISRAIGREISDEAAKSFVEFGKKRPSKSMRKVIKQSAAKRLVERKEAAKVRKHKNQIARRGIYEATDAFLASYEWKVLRMQVLKRDGARCACCGASPADGARMHVDHIKPRRRFPELATDLENLQVLCSACNHGKGNWDSTDWRPQTDELPQEHQAHLRSILDADSPERRI
jgi:5-methylcytosine-specific restriction endonuclease McrA